MSQCQRVRPQQPETSGITFKLAVSNTAGERETFDITRSSRYDRGVRSLLNTAHVDASCHLEETCLSPVPPKAVLHQPVVGASGFVRAVPTSRRAA
jgi:hypothetical protein